MTLTPTRRWFQFSLATWFVLVAILAWCFRLWPWWIDRWRNLSGFKQIAGVPRMPPVYREVGINPALVWPALALAAFVGWKCVSLASPRQRRFQFGLRAIFVAMTLVGCWLAYELHWIRPRREILDRGRVRLAMHSSGWLVRTPPLPLPWLGEQSPQAAALALYPTASDEEVAQVRSLFPEMRVTRDSD